MIPQWEQDVINSKTKQFVFVMEFLTKDEQSMGEITLDIISGNANFDRTKNSRRSATLIIKNINNEYIPQLGGKLWIDNKIRLKAGYLYDDNQLLLYNQGVFVLGNPSILSSPSQKEITLQLFDKYSLLDGTLSGKAKNKIIIPVNTKVDNAIRAIINLTGETKFVIDECLEILPYTIEKEAGTTYASILEEIANIVSYEIYYDNNSYLRFSKALQLEDYQSTPSSWNYTTSGLYLESIRELQWQDIKNSIVVLGDIINGIQVYGTAQNYDNPYFGINAIGERVEIIEDTNIYNNDLANQRAVYELNQRMMLAETVKTKIIPNFSHQIGDIINVTDTNNGSNGNYIIQSIDYDFSYNATMNLSLYKVS